MTIHHPEIPGRKTQDNPQSPRTQAPLAAAAVRAGDDLQPVTVGVVEVQAAAAVVVVDRPGPAFAGIRPVRQPPVPDAAEGGVDHEKMPEPGGRRQAENLAQEGRRPLLVTAGDDGVVQSHAHADSPSLIWFTWNQ